MFRKLISDYRDVKISTLMRDLKSYTRKQSKRALPFCPSLCAKGCERRQGRACGECGEIDYYYLRGLSEDI